ncbi:hypothetical protein EJB05_13224, partial [Eragrostis curvula]
MPAFYTSPHQLQRARNVAELRRSATAHRRPLSGSADVLLPEGVLPWDVQVPSDWTAHWESNQPLQ